MMSWLKRDLISYQVQKKELEKALRSKQLILVEEQEKTRKCKEQELQANNTLKSLMANIEAQ